MFFLVRRMYQCYLALGIDSLFYSLFLGELNTLKNEKYLLFSGHYNCQSVIMLPFFLSVRTSYSELQMDAPSIDTLQVHQAHCIDLIMKSK